MRRVDGNPHYQLQQKAKPVGEVDARIRSCATTSPNRCTRPTAWGSRRRRSGCTSSGKQKEATNTLLSVCVQHEMNHLQGLFVDHLSALKRELIKRRMKKLKTQREAERKGQATVL